MNSRNRALACALSLGILMPPVLCSELGDSGQEPHWSYADQRAWGELTDAEVTLKPPYPFAVCSIGRAQSPVDLARPARVKSVNGLHFEYTHAPLVVENNGHTIQVKNPWGRLYIGEDEYQLLQYHFHAPSEHVIGTITFPLELHLVHRASNGKAAVVGVLFKEGRENRAFQTILDNAPYTETRVVTQLMLNPRGLLPARKNRFYSYGGSLTTPPCTEGVDWYVLSQPVEVSSSQLLQFRTFYSDNVREIQPLNLRAVSLKSR